MSNPVLIWWIVVQAFFIGWVGTEIHNQVKSGTYDCSWNYVSRWEGAVVTALVPLSLIVPDDYAVVDYCRNKTP